MQILYSYHGDRFKREARRSINSLIKLHPDADILVNCPPTDLPPGSMLNIQHDSRVASVKGYQYKVQGIANAQCERFVFFDTDTKLVNSLMPLWQSLEQCALVGVIDPLRDTFHHVPQLKRPPEWKRYDSPICEINTGVLGINRALLPPGFFENWLARHAELCEHNEDMPTSSVPDQPSFRQALLDASVIPLLLGPEYNFRPYYPQVLYGPPVIIHAHVDSKVAFRDGVENVTDVSVTLPWGAVWRRSSKLHRIMFFIYRVFVGV